MNYGPIIFLAAFFALASSWLGFVLTPQMQVGHLQTTNGVPAGMQYPLGRSGLAREGEQIYRANGCAYCHSQQVVQTGTVCDVLLNEPGTNQPALISALRKLRPGIGQSELEQLVKTGGNPVLRGVDKQAADAAAKTVSSAGAKAQVWLVPIGPDMARGWGKRRTVAQDFLFDSPPMPGSVRIGPDLANIGVRQPDPNWHLRHLYAPAAEVKGSTMTAYKFLFERRRVEGPVSPDALRLPSRFSPKSGYEIVPRYEARALVAYLLSLRSDQPLFEAPLSLASAAPASSDSGTNAPSSGSGGATNAPSAGPGATQDTNRSSANPAQK